MKTNRNQCSVRSGVKLPSHAQKVQLFTIALLAGLVCCSGVFAQTGSLTPKRAYDYWNSTGVNIHPDSPNSRDNWKPNGQGCYNQRNWGQMASDLRTLGIAHVRSRLVNTDFNITWMREQMDSTLLQSYISWLKSLTAANGRPITALLTWDAGGDWGSSNHSQLNYVSSIGNSIKAYLPAIDAVEVANEPDWFNYSYAGASFPTAAYWQTSDVVNILGWTGVPTSVKALAPPLTNSRNYTVSGVTSSFDSRPGLASQATNYNAYGNGHYYPNLLPDSSWAATTRSGDIANAQAFTGTRPIYCSETGYSSIDFNNGDTYVMGYYQPLLYCENFRLGIARTYIYELYDEPYLGSGREGGFGLMNYWSTSNTTVWESWGSPKTSYTGIQYMLSILNDSGSNAATFSPSNSVISSVQLSGAAPSAGSNVHYFLLQKSNGNYALVIWNDVSLWVNWADVPMGNTVQNVRLATTQGRNFNVYRPCDSHATPVQTASNATSITFGVPAQVTIVEIY